MQIDDSGNLTLGQLLDEIKKMSTEKLFGIIQKSLLDSHEKVNDPKKTSQKRLFKEYGQLLQTNIS